MFLKTKSRPLVKRKMDKIARGNNEMCRMPIMGIKDWGRT
jgi:hypothetical protein